MKTLNEKIAHEPNETWLNGKYNNGEINTLFSYVAVNPDFFCQGQEADEIISEIHQIWINSDLTQEQAFNQWINSNF